MADFDAHTLIGDENRDVMFLRDMIEESEKAELERKQKAKNKFAGEIFEEEENSKGGDDGGIDTWLADIQEKDRQLRQQQEQRAAAAASGGMPPVRNSAKRGKKVQVGPSDVEIQKAEEKKGAKVDENGVPKHQKYYQYDYFKEWDKFDVDNEIKRLEEEDKKQEEYKNFAKSTADPFEEGDSSDPNDTYKIEGMTPLERRLAAQREKEKGNECMKCGETNAASIYYSKSLELSPGNHLVLGNRAQAYIGMHCFLQAEMDCDQALAIEPGYTKAYYRRAVACKEQGKYAEAIRDLEALLGREPEHKLAGSLLAECERKRDAKQKETDEKRRREEERARYEAAPRRKIAIQEVEDDEDSDGEADDDDGLDKGAMDAARESVRLKKEEEERLLKLEAAKRKKDEGNAAVKGKDLAAAARHYEAALKLLPEGEKQERCLIFSNRAHVYLQQGEYGKAEGDCTRALEANPQWAKAHHRRGVALGGLGRYAEALEDLERALKLESDSKQTVDEIKRLRKLQQEAKGRAAPAPAGKRVQIVEIDSDEEEEEEEAGKGKADTDSEDEDMVVIDKASACPSPERLKKEAAALGDEGEIVEDDVPITASGARAPEAGGRVRIQIVESDSEEEEEEAEEEAPVVDGFSPAKAFAGSRPGFVFKMGAKGLGYYEDKAAADASSLAKARESAAKAKEEERKRAEEEKRKEEERKRKEEEDKLAKAQAEAAAAAEAAKAKAKAVPWEARGRDAKRLAAGKELKDKADEMFKKGLFEQAADVYSESLGALGEAEEFEGERTLCYSNRAACRLQVRDYGATIADCNEVLCVDEDNVKALLRRAQSNEGLERYAKAARDCRELLSIEYARGEGLSNVGLKARECLERCKKQDPEQRSIPIPVRSSSPPRAAAAPAAAAAAAPAPAPAKEDAAAAPAGRKPQGKKVQIVEEEEEEEVASPATKGKEGAGAKEEGAKKTKSFAEIQHENKVLEAQQCKERGNAAFKAGKHHNAIMHYSAAIDLIPTDPAFYTNLAAAHYALKDYPNTLKMAEQALKADNKSAKGHYRRAQALEGLGRHADARAAYEEGVAILPASEQLRSGLAAVTARLEAQKGAEAEALAKLKAMESAKQQQQRQPPPPQQEAPKGKEGAVKGDAHIIGGESKGGAGRRQAPGSAAALKKQLKTLQRDGKALYGYLDTVPGDSIGKLLVGGIEEEQLMPVVRALDDHGVDGDAGHAFEMVRGVSRVPRVGITVRMLDRKDANRLEKLVLRLHPAKAAGASYSLEEWDAVRKALIS